MFSFNHLLTQKVQKIFYKKIKMDMHVMGLRNKTIIGCICTKQVVAKER